MIDLADLAVFWDDWLWEACWRDNYIAVYGLSGGGGGMLMMESLAIESVQSVVPEKSLEEQLADAEVIVDWLEKMSKNKEFFDYVDKKVWAEFVDEIYDWLSDLEALIDDKYSY